MFCSQFQRHGWLKSCRRARLLFFLLLLLIYSPSFFLHDGNIQECKVPEVKRKTVTLSSSCNCTKQVFVSNSSDWPAFSIPPTHKDQFTWCSDESNVRGPHQKVIAYTLYGQAQMDAEVFRRYYTLLRNISATAENEYPGWVVRIYHNLTATVGGEPNEAYRHLCKVYCRHHNIDLCDVPRMADRFEKATDGVVPPIEANLVRGLNPRMFRYLVMLDPDVDVFISRDVDSIIWRREVDAVKEWLSSNYTFHLMRDQPEHFVIMLAGMWGAKLHQRRDLIEGLARAMILFGQNHADCHDQTTLDDILWQAAKYDVMAHDSYHCRNERLLDTSPIRMFPFPTQREGSYYVGGVGHEQRDVFKCPLACRPPHHQDWEFC